MTSESSAKPTFEEASNPAQAKGPTFKHKFEGHCDSVCRFVFLHDNVHIVSASWDGTMRKWNCDTGRLIEAPWKGEGGSIYALALSPDGKTIACGRGNGSIQHWNTDGKMIEGVWIGHSKGVRSLSWSPSGSHLSSGSYDGTILIRNGESGKVEVGPIKTKQDRVLSLAYSPSGHRIASGGSNEAICIWDSKNGKRVVGPIKGLGNWVWSLVWSSDSTKLYSASDNFLRIFDSTSGKLLHRFEYDDSLKSVALSPTKNVLACVGLGVAQLWDAESHQPLDDRPFRQDCQTLYCVSFSRDGRYLAYGGYDRKLTLWMVKDIAPGLAVPIPREGHKRVTPEQEIRPKSPSSSCLDADATKQSGGDGIVEEVCDDPYDNFFQPSLPSLSSSHNLPYLSSARSFWNIISRRRPPADESVPRERQKRGFFTYRARSNSPPEPTTIISSQSTPEGQVRAGEEDKDDEKDDDCSANAPLSASNNKTCQDKQREGSLTNVQSPSPDVSAPPAEPNSEENRNLWKRLKRARGKDHTSATMAPATKRSEIVEVYAVRGFQRYVAMTPKRKTKSPAVMCNAPLGKPAAHASDSSQPGLSSQAVSIQAGPSSHTMVSNGAQCSRAVGGSSSHTSPSHFVTTYHASDDSDSDSIQGSWNKFLDKICFPCGHYHEDT